jgi:diaminopimelate dehydrogenase
MEKIKIGIVGYGNLGRGVEAAMPQNPDMELAGIFTRRGPGAVRSASGAAVYAMDALAQHRGQIDVMILCGGSKSDLPQQGPALAAHFSTVDSFDTHAKIPDYFAEINAAATAAGTTAIISVGWDPGLFSIFRLYGQAILPAGDTATFWGKGVSQGHSDALRRVPGVNAAVQYTIPLPDAIEKVRAGQGGSLTTRDKHARDCYVVLNDGADAAQVEQAIVTMPDYFADYDTTVHFITEDELTAHHSAMPHGGFVIRNAKSGGGASHTIEYSLQLESNPEFTSSVLVAYARAAYRLNKKGITGAQTVFDVAPALLSPQDPAALRKELL